MSDSSSSWESSLPADLGALPLGGRLVRTEPGGVCPAPVAIVGLYPALTKTARHTLRDGTRILLPSEVERNSFEGSRSAQEIEARYLTPLGLRRDHVFFIDLYPYFLANTARSSGSGRSMWDNVKRYHAETGTTSAVEGRPDEAELLVRCRTPGNRERLASWFSRCRPRLILTLGNEVAAYVRGYAAAKAAQKHLYAEPIESRAFGTPARIAHCAHPGVFIRRAQNNPWVAQHDVWCAGSGAALVAEALHDWPGR